MVCESVDWRQAQLPTAYCFAIVSRAAWTPLVNTLVKLFISDHGLRMDATGKLLSAVLLLALLQKNQRDKVRGYLEPIAEETDACRVPLLRGRGAHSGKKGLVHFTFWAPEE